MIFTLNNIILLGSILLLAGILLSKTSYRFGIPGLMLFLVTGLLAGVDGIGGIHFDNFYVAQLIGNIALIFILFSGGMDTSISSVKPIWKKGVVLATLGVLFTAAGIGLVVYALTGFTIEESFLIGSIVSSTDAAAVFGLFRSKSMGLKHNLRPLLELESGSNDPMAYFLTISCIALIQNPETSLWMFIYQFAKSLVLGALLGYVAGRAIKWLINRVNLEVEGLYPVLAISLSLLTFSCTDFVGGNGFLAVYVAGVMLGNHRFIHKRSLIKFFDGLSWLMQVVMFLTLGLLANPKSMLPILGIGLLISLSIIFIVRPVAVYLSLVFWRNSPRDLTFISWGGLKGAVPIVFAIYPLVAGLENAQMIFNIVFIISVSSLLLQGMTLTKMSDWLRVSVPVEQRKPNPLDYDFSEEFKSEMFEIKVQDDSPAAGKAIFELQVPQTALILLIYRDGKYFSPRGSTIIFKGDRLTFMSDDNKVLPELTTIFGDRATPI